MPRMSKRSGAYHHGDLRRVLVEAAVRVVDKEGLAALSLHALAKKAGVSSGAPYHHFESREQLLAEIAVEGYQLLGAEMKRHAEEAEAGAGTMAPSEAYVRGLARGYVQFALSHRGHFRLMFRPEVKQHLDDAQNAIANDAFAMLGRAIERCQRDKTIGRGDPRALVLLSWSAVHGACVLWIDGPLASVGLVDEAAGLGAAIADALAATLFKP